MSLVSVIVAVYNGEKYIKQCVDSILAQSYKNTEIIVINNASTDRTAQLLLEYTTVKTVTIAEKGVANARNYGLDAAKGEYILFLDSDDFLDSDAISKLVGAAKEKNADITRFRLKYLLNDGRVKTEEPDFENEFFILKPDFYKYIYRAMLVGIAFNSVCRCLYKAEVIRGIKFDTIMLTAEDLLFNIQAFTNAQSFLYLSDVYYNYIMTGEGLTGKGLPVITKYKCNAIISKKLKKYLKIWGQNTITNRLLTDLRLLSISLSKVKRIFKRVV